DWHGEPGGPAVRELRALCAGPRRPGWERHRPGGRPWHRGGTRRPRVGRVGGGTGELLHRAAPPRGTGGVTGRRGRRAARIVVGAPPAACAAPAPPPRPPPPPAPAPARPLPARRAPPRAPPRPALPPP